MASRGRKSADELGITVINVQAQRLKAPEYLKDEARAIFEAIVGSRSPTHFKANEQPLLALYCTALHLARFYAEQIGAEDDHGSAHKHWVENCKMATSLSAKLRLAPASRYDARAAERNSLSPAIDGPRPWDRSE